MRYLISLLLLVPTIGWAEDELVIDDVSGGLSTTLPSYKIGKNYSPYMRNTVIDNGKLEKPNGFITVGSSRVLQSGQGIFPFVQEDGSTEFGVTDSSYVLTTSDFSFFTFVSSGHNNGVLMRCKQIRNNLWCSNGIDPVFSWNRTSKTILNGNNGTPNVPKGKYMEYYQERVWMANVSNNASQVCYSDFRSTNGVSISPENFLAWPAGNCLNVGQGDGQIITGIWIENGQLQIGKERSIYTLFGTNASNYSPRLSNKDVGVASHDSIVLLDGEAHFLGQDGIYRGRQRISDNIKTEVEQINKDTVRVVQNAWETQSDFAKGQFVNSTATVDGFVQLYSGDYTVNYATDTVPAENYIRLSDADPTHGFAVFQPTITVSSNGLFTIKSWANVLALNLTGSASVQWTIYNTRTTDISTFTKTASNNPSTIDFVTPNVPIFNSTMTILGDDLNSGNISIKVRLLGALGDPGFYIDCTSTKTGVSSMILTAQTTGQFMSEVATLTAVTAWGTIDSRNVTGGGSINYFYRTSTSAVNITTQPWASFSPGTVINAPIINNYIQWASTIHVTAKIDNVTIDHVEGAGAVNRAFAIDWKNRYWLFVTTEASNFSLLYMKSRITNSVPDAFMPIEGINVRSIAKAGNSLYAGSSSTGVFYRLDYGTNYNGSPIVSIYDTPDLFMNTPFKEKNLNEFYLTADRATSKTLTFGLAKNGGAFSYRTINLDGSGRYNQVIQNVSGKAKLFRFRFIQDQLDQGFNLTNFAVNYTPTEIRRGIGE